MSRPMKFCTILNDERIEYLAASGYSKARRSAACNTPETIAQILEDDYMASRQAQEHVWVIATDVKCRAIGTFEVSKGSANEAMFPVREILKDVLMCQGVMFMVAHNHPSGDPTPSKEDIASTKNIIAGAKAVGLTLCDHVIIGDTGVFSFRRSMENLFER